MKKVGILGGTFDPVHTGHLIIADQVLSILDLDEIRFMPNGRPPHKIKETNSTNEDRLNMLQLAISDHPRFRIETIELNRDGKSYTYDTMVLLKQREPDTDFYFIIGADMVDYLPHWYRVDDLISLVQFVGVNRPGYQGKTDYPIVMIDIPMIHISSSMIREKIKKRESIRYLVPDKVLEYVKEHQLYE